MMFDIQSPLNH